VTQDDPVVAGARPLRVLLVEDSAEDAALLIAVLRRRGYKPEWQQVDKASAYKEALAQQTWDCILSDYEMPGFSWLGALQLLHESRLDLPFIVVSGAIGEETAIAAMKAGAHDYVMKDNLARLGPAIERELRDAEVRRERRRVAAVLEEDAAVAAALSRVAQELITRLDSPALMVSLCKVTAEVLACDSSHTLFWQPDQQLFQSIAGYGGTPEEQEIARVVTVPRSMMRDLLSCLEQDDVTEVRTPALDALTTPQQGDTIQMCMALRRGRELIGIQVVKRRDYHGPFAATHKRVGRGITQLASLMLEHARVRQELERSNRLKSDFVATMSHELRTPLNIIMGYLDLALEGDFGAITPELSDVLGRAAKSAVELLDLINATLNLSRLEKGETSVDLEPVDLTELVAAVAAQTFDAPSKPGVSLICEVPPDLGSIYTDSVKLKVILRNLIANAVKFTDEGSVTVAATAHAAGVTISVSDTGIGIKPDVVPIIFEPFRQGESSMTRRFGGVGLGLYIVRRLLDILGGTIAVETEVQRGSTFKVWIPNPPPPSGGPARVRGAVA
jgi:signal transduction histidine kinase/FixJ family two-component response regulator